MPHASGAITRMNVLIVESNPALADLWASHLRRQGAEVSAVHGESAAVTVLEEESQPCDVIVLNLVLDEGSAFAVADFASFRHPKARIIFVTGTSFFSDGSIFQLVPNACAYLPAATPVEDLAALVEHYGRVQ
jgi:DNA-binding NtrC family response regulator